MIFTNVRSTFHYGRVKPGAFEYPILNGWMLVEQAVYKCENNCACGGFTFKGSYRTIHKPMEMYFFHVVKLPEEIHETIVRSLAGFLSKFHYLSEKFLYLKDVMEKIHKNSYSKYLYWSTYKVDRDYVHISHMKLKNGQNTNSKEMTIKYVKDFRIGMGLLYLKTVFR